MGAGFSINTFPKQNGNLKVLNPGVGITGYFPVNRFLDYNINLNGSFTQQFEKDAIPSNEKTLLVETSALVRLRMVAGPSWIQPFIISGIVILKYKDNYVGFSPARAGIEFSYKNIFLIPGVQYHLPFSSTFNGYVHYNISLLGAISWKKEKPSVHKPDPSLNVYSDKDGDGILDIKDECPDLPGLIAFSGCPDSDNDGVQDKEDECPRVFGFLKYKGCPIPDTDKDGINDEEDSCKLLPGVVRYHGCPIPDEDQDGTNDEEDSCAKVPGPSSNKGCPVITKEVSDEMRLAAKNIFFETASFKLLSKSYPALNNVVQILSNNPELKLVIEGHTDNQGKEQFNQVLSENRAKAIVNYLKSKGVGESRLKTVGYGQTKPVESNATSEGRAKNRRVELKLYY